ncbi:hypothetical protein [Chryseobacterium caseinilyticum]|uniref:C1q domain-containing protein n=1 Tax=Chryseobacterium caseinilyticum TaxID=2771428 RepID=A0ABR8ZEP8_9FLAO|nr:hypothetical protein [Chryseobacterium caseinilyticum]MBD8083365.1 hypothetical protein [Chryseobacterium caseinilyticum]
MKKCYVLLAAALCSYSINAQVGINTTTPKGTLDVTGSPTVTTIADGIIPPRITGDALKSKESAYGPDQNGALVYVTTPVSTTTGAVKTANVVRKGFYIYDATFVNSGNVMGTFSEVDMVTPGGTPGNGGATGDGAYAARFTGSSSLLSLNVGLGSTFYAVPLSNAAVVNNIPSVQVANNQYTVPSSGIYQINYSFRYEQGLIASVLASAPEMRILKTTSGVSSTLDSRTFGGITLLPTVTLLGISLGASITLADGQISHIYNLQQGDVLTFGIQRGGLDLSVASNSAAEISVYKIK